MTRSPKCSSQPRPHHRHTDPTYRKLVMHRLAEGEKESLPRSKVLEPPSQCKALPPPHTAPPPQPQGVSQPSSNTTQLCTEIGTPTQLTVAPLAEAEYNAGGGIKQQQSITIISPLPPYLHPYHPTLQTTPQPSLIHCSASNYDTCPRAACYALLQCM